MIKIGDRVNRIEDRSIRGATVLSIIESPDLSSPELNTVKIVLELQYDEGGNGWWPSDCVEHIPSILE